MIYLDNHATTRCDDRVIAAMLPWLTEQYGNPHSTSHAMGRVAADAVDESRRELAAMLGAPEAQWVFTSGATESCNLAIKGVCLHPRQKRRHLVTVTTEHPAVLDACDQVQRAGFRVTRVNVLPPGDARAGTVDLAELADVVDDDTALVSVMWANNEIGAITPLREVAEICHRRGALLHSDATQAVGRVPVDMLRQDVDLLSASAHKFYGPKGVGLLAIGSSQRRIRIKPEIVGGGQQGNLRSGTLNCPGIIAMAAALRLSVEAMESESQRIAELRDRLAKLLFDGIEGLLLNGPRLESVDRLGGNLNVTLPEIEGEAWMSATDGVAFSSGSACSSVDPTPSHVLLALGLSESEARRSVRFGLGRFSTREEIDDAARMLVDAYRHLVRLIG